MTDRKHNHYFKLCPYPHIDVYRVLELFEVTDPALQHIIKKALCAGQRGAKDFRKDLEEIVDTGNRRIEMLNEDGEFVAVAASDEGWIAHDGGDLPVDENVRVEVRFRCLKTNPAYSAGGWEWSHSGGPHDIIAYRPHK
ncbi:MAG: hypothetical protein ABS69_00940 [Nitrosomonadales bacterium SCN 54-20]|nr:MAG: hypothetical protein ABS69_00940 [Nitrosomonadales bacterium SCN 54-20]